MSEIDDLSRQLDDFVQGLVGSVTVGQRQAITNGFLLLARTLNNIERIANALESIEYNQVDQYEKSNS